MRVDRGTHQYTEAGSLNTSLSFIATPTWMLKLMLILMLMRMQGPSCKSKPNPYPNPRPDGPEAGHSGQSEGAGGGHCTARGDHGVWVQRGGHSMCL